jgi:hypothetical protein
MSSTPEPKPQPTTSTYGESLRHALATGAKECPHGELRGPAYCALCRGVRSRSLWR